MKQKVMFTQTVTRTIEYDSENPANEENYGTSDVDKMIQIDLEYANDNTFEFFDQSGDLEWGPITATKEDV